MKSEIFGYVACGFSLLCVLVIIIVSNRTFYYKNLIEKEKIKLSKTRNPKGYKNEKRNGLKMKLHQEDIDYMEKEMHLINSTPIEEIALYKDGVKIEFTKECLNEWRLTGLNNWNFLLTEFYRKFE